MTYTILKFVFEVAGNHESLSRSIFADFLFCAQFQKVTWGRERPVFSASSCSVMAGLAGGADAPLEALSADSEAGRPDSGGARALTLPSSGTPASSSSSHDQVLVTSPSE